MIADEAWVDTVRLAREIGDVSGLLPTGIRSLRDVPYQFLQAVKAALIFLSFEEMPEEDRPPRGIWTNTELLNEHLADVRRKYKRGSEVNDDDRPAARNAAVGLLIAR